ncbi:hypothetical protein KYD79_26440 [Escherichia coli]|nr:hypothetical protein [Escherichia coli]
MDHRVASCPKRSESRAVQVCFHCREPGHIKPRCPKLQMAVAIVQPGQVVAADVQPLRQVTAPRVYTSMETGGSSARPITGNFRT